MPNELPERRGILMDDMFNASYANFGTHGKFTPLPLAQYTPNQNPEPRTPYVHNSVYSNPALMYAAAGSLAGTVGVPVAAATLRGAGAAARQVPKINYLLQGQKPPTQLYGDRLGRAGRWLNRLAPWLGLPGSMVSGAFDMATVPELSGLVGSSLRRNHYKDLASKEKPESDGTSKGDLSAANYSKYTQLAAAAEEERRARADEYAVNKGLGTIPAAGKVLGTPWQVLRAATRPDNYNYKGLRNAIRHIGGRRTAEQKFVDHGLRAAKRFGVHKLRGLSNSNLRRLGGRALRVASFAPRSSNWLAGRFPGLNTAFSLGDTAYTTASNLINREEWDTGTNDMVSDARGYQGQMLNDFSDGNYGSALRNYAMSSLHYSDPTRLAILGMSNVPTAAGTAWDSVTGKAQENRNRSTARDVSAAQQLAMLPLRASARVANESHGLDRSGGQSPVRVIRNADGTWGFSHNGVTYGKNNPMPPAVDTMYRFPEYAHQFQSTDSQDRVHSILAALQADKEGRFDLDPSDENAFGNLPGDNTLAQFPHEDAGQVGATLINPRHQQALFSKAVDEKNWAHNLVETRYALARHAVEQQRQVDAGKPLEVSPEYSAQLQAARVLEAHLSSLEAESRGGQDTDQSIRQIVSRADRLSDDYRQRIARQDPNDPVYRAWARLMRPADR